jgi:hypothetical protein
MKKAPLTFRLILLTALLLTIGASGCTEAPISQAVTGPKVWIDAPLPGTQHPLAPVEVMSHANSVAGVAAFELSVDGEVLQISDAPGDQMGENLVYVRQTWEPLEPQMYVISVRARDVNGDFGPRASVQIRVGEPTPTPSPEATLTATLTPTDTATPAAPSISDPDYSALTFFYESGACGPKDLTIDVEAPSPAIYSVVLFYRLADAEGSDRTDWTSVAMNPIGEGLYRRSLHSESDIPDFASFLKAFLQLQFVATDSNGDEVTRTEVFSDVTLQGCGG